MRQLKQLSLLLGLLLLGPSAYAQSVRFQSQAISTRGAGIANATIAVCTQPSNTNTQPCSPLATLATSTSTTSGGVNPLTADSFGNFFFYAAPGRYTVQIYGPAVSGQFVIPDVEVASTGGNAPITTPDINHVKIIDGCTGVATPTFACSDAGLQAAQNSLGSGGEIWITSNNAVLTISNTVNISNPYIMIRCAGLNTGITVANTGDVFNVTNNGFVFADCRVAFSQTGTRTGAVIHANAAAAVSGVVYDIYASGNAAATNNGIFFLADQPSAGSWQLNQVQMPRGATWTAAFKFSNSSATTTIQGFTVQQFVGGASFTDAAMVIDGAVDTVQVTQSKFNNDSTSGKTIHFRNTFGTYNVTSFAFPRWAYFDQVSCESTTTSTCLQADTGRQFHYLNGYIAASGTAAAIGASTTDTDISHNTVASIQNGAFTVANGALNTNLSYNSINDVSQVGANTADVFSVAANTTDVSIVGNQYRCPSSVTFHNAVTIAGGTGTRLKVVNNNFPNTSCIGTGVVSSGATGADVQIYGNGDLNSTNSRFFLGAGELSFGETSGVTNQTAGQDNCAGASATHTIQCSYNAGAFSSIPLTGIVNSFTGNTAALTADWTCGTGGTVSSCTSATIIGSGGGVPLTFTLPSVATSYTLECDGVVSQATAVTANQWNLLTATNGATNVTANYSMATAATASAYGAVTDQASTTTTFQIAPSWTLGAITTKMPFHIWAKVEGASASGTVVSLQLLAPTVGDLVTIFRGTACRVF